MFLSVIEAITRKTESGAVFGADQFVSRAAAHRMLTSDAAWLHFDKSRKGTLEVGKLGDLAVLNEDSFTPAGSGRDDNARIRERDVGSTLQRSEKVRR